VRRRLTDERRSCGRSDRAAGPGWAGRAGRGHHVRWIDVGGGGGCETARQLLSKRYQDLSSPTDTDAAQLHRPGPETRRLPPPLPGGTKCAIPQSIKTLIHVDRPQRDKVHMVKIKIKSTMIHNNNNLNLNM